MVFSGGSLDTSNSRSYAGGYGPVEPGPIGPGQSAKSGPVFWGRGDGPLLKSRAERRHPSPTSPVIAIEPTDFRGSPHEANGLFLLETRGQQIEKREDASPSIMSPHMYQMRG